MAIHLFDRNRHEITLVSGKILTVEPSRCGRWPIDDERLPLVVLRWARLNGHVGENDEVAVLACESAPGPA